MLSDGLIGAPEGPEGFCFLSKYMLHVLTLGLTWGIQDKSALEFLCGVQAQAREASVLQVLWAQRQIQHNLELHHFPAQVSNPALKRHLMQVGSRAQGFQKWSSVQHAIVHQTASS